MRPLAALFALALGSLPASAQTPYVWNPVTGTWSTPGNWTPTGPPPSDPATILNFGGLAAYTSTNNIGAGTFQLNQINISNTGATTISGASAANTLTFAGANPALTVAAGSGASTVTNNSSNLLLLGGPQTFNAGATVTYGGAGNISLAPTVQTPSLSFADGSGITYIGSGQLNVGPQGVNGALNNIVFANNGTYNFVNGVVGGGSTGTLSMGDNSSTGANTTLLYNPATAVTLNFSNYSSGLLTVGNFGEMTGTVNILAGTVRFGIAGGTANVGGNLFGGGQILNVASGATFDFNGNAESMGGIAGAGTIKGANVTAGLAGNYVFAGNFSTNTFGTSSGVNYTLTGANTSTGSLSVAAGSTVSLGNGGTSGSWAGTIANAGTLQFNRSDAYTQPSVISGAGTVAQVGTGMTTLSGTNTFTGPVSVTNGTLAIATAAALPAASTQTTVNGGVLDLSAITAGYTFGTGRTLTVGRTGTAANDVLGNVTVAGTLNVAGSGTAGTATFANNLTLSSATARFDLSGNPAAGNDLVNVAGGLNLTGTTAIQVNQSSGLLGSGTYPLFNYGTLTGNTSNLSLSGLGGGTTRQTFTLNAGTGTNSAVSLAVSGSAANLTYTNASGNSTWDLITSVNWTGAPGPTPDNRFYNLDTVAFTDAAAGAVTLAGTLQPTTVTVNSSADYQFTGSGSIAGSGTLTKSGTGTLTIGTANTYTGTTTVTAGTLTFASGGSISGPVVVTGGTLAANQANDLGGTLTVQGGTATGTVANSLPGTVTISGGTVSVPSFTSFPTAAANIALSGGTLQVTGSSPTNTNQVVTVNGTGTFEVVGANAVVSVLGNQFLGTTGAVLNKTGAGTLTLGSSGTSTVPTYNVQAGALRETSNRLGGTTAVNVASGATFQNFDTVTFTTAAPLALAAGGSITLNGGDGAPVPNTPLTGAYLHTLDEAGSANAGINVPFTLANGTVSRFTQTAGTSGTRTAGDYVIDTFQQPIGGGGGLVKGGEGHMVLAATNTYTGPTTAAAGYLYYTGNSAASTGAVTVQSGATVGGAGGAVGGAITVQSGGTLRGDTSTLPTGGVPTGVLTTADVTVQSGGRLGANLAAPGTSSQLAVGNNHLNLATGSTALLASVAGFDPTAPGTYVLARFATGSGGNLQLDGTGVADGFSFGQYTQGSGASGPVVLDVTGVSGLTAGESLNLSRSGDNLVLTLTPVPVPEPAALLGVGVLGLGLVRAVRRRNAAARA